MAYVIESVDGAGVVFTLPLAGNQTAAAYYWWKMTLAMSPPASDTRLLVYLDTTTLNPPAFSGSHLPSTAGTLLASVTVPAGTTSFDIQLQPETPYYRQSNWSGRLAFSLFTMADSLTVSSISLDTGGVSIESGRSGFTYEDGDGSLVRCAKCARVDLYPNMMKDGYFKGLWVCPECYDPEEPQRVPPRPETPPDLGGA